MTQDSLHSALLRTSDQLRMHGICLVCYTLLHGICMVRHVHRCTQSSGPAMSMHRTLPEKGFGYSLHNSPLFLPLCLGSPCGWFSMSVRHQVRNRLPFETAIGNSQELPWHELISLQMPLCWATPACTNLLLTALLSMVNHCLI